MEKNLQLLNKQFPMASKNVSCPTVKPEPIENIVPPVSSANTVENGKLSTPFVEKPQETQGTALQPHSTGSKRTTLPFSEPTKRQKINDDAIRSMHYRRSIYEEDKKMILQLNKRKLLLTN